MKIIVSDSNPIFKYILDVEEIESILLSLDEDECDETKDRVYIKIMMKDGEEHTINESLEMFANAIDAKIVDPFATTLFYLKQREERLEKYQQERFNRLSQNEEDQ